MLRDYTLETINLKMNWEYYLTGLIEADGSIYVPKKEKCIRNLKNLYPSIQISFHAKDFPLIVMIQKKIKAGSISRIKGKRAYVLTITSNQGVLDLINVLNGKMRTNKILQLYSLIDWRNSKSLYGFLNNKGELIKKKDLDRSPFCKNAWLSGFIDGDGCFYLRCTEKGKYPSKFECKFEISQSSNNLLGHGGSENNIIKIISSFLGSNPKEIKKNSKNPQWRSRTVTADQNRTLVNYLTEYPLQSSKFLDFKDWSNGVDIFLKKEHKTDLGKEKILVLKKNMNDSRRFYSWDHIIYF